MYLKKIFFFLLFWVFVAAKVFSSCGKWALLSSCGAWASHCSGFLAVERRLQGLQDLRLPSSREQTQ